MKKPDIRIACFILAAAVLAACSDSAAPDQVPLSAEDAQVLRSVTVSGPDDVPLEDGDVMPDEFRRAPLIYNTILDVGFLPRKAFATARMDYFASHARINLKLRLKRAGALVDSDSAVAENDEFLAWFLSMPARINISTSTECGHQADASVSFRAWMGFPLPRTGTLFSWGLITRPESETASQPPCPTGVFNSSQRDWLSEFFGDDFFGDEGFGEGEDADDELYGGDCESCQRWYLLEDDVVLATWWECTLIDDFYCDDLRDAR